MDYKEFEQAIDFLGILTRVSKKDVKNKYLKLCKKYHPDVQGGSNEKFLKLKYSYDLVNTYMDSFEFICDEEEFKEQNPSFMNYKNWNK